MKKLIYILFLILILSACNNNHEEPYIERGDENKELNESEASKELVKIKFDLDTFPNTNHTGIYVADQLGYYEEAGIDLDIVQPSEVDSIPNVSTGFAEFGVSSQDYIAEAISGDSKLPIVAIASITEHNNTGILSLKSKNINSLKDLEGKTYESWDLVIEHGIISTLMEREGADFNKVKKVPFSPIDEVDALRTDHVDAVWVYYGWDGIKSEVEGLETNYIKFKDLDPVFDFYSPVIIVNEDFMNKNPELVKLFLKETKRGYEYAIENPKEAAEIFLDSNPDASRDLVIKSQEWISKEYKGTLDEWGVIDPEKWALFMQWLETTELVSGEIDINSGFTNEFLE